ncbi:hypothetical protein PVL29_005933 [Vitis rotundifolia]|uniref:SHSP domain-containing protein n=1 Tax=Vitis rotundifolia TaxID=103349 RepID=A0AA39DY56_VITRO|nr:hypothetical protein PVL29_005933 [Vitis rotundifolia]
MKVHPVQKKRNITFRYEINANLSDPLRDRLMGSTQKKLRRLPHIFSRVLELPFKSDADVAVEESSDCFRFVAVTDDIGDIRAHTVEIHPGVTKIVIRGSDVVELTMNELELDMWRFRLPATTRPELASAVYVDGELVVTVPKCVGMEGAGGGGGEEGGVWEGGGGGQLRGGVGGRLVVVLCLRWNFVKLVWVFYIDKF